MINIPLNKKDNLTYPAYVVANTFIDLFKQANKKLQRIQLIKMMYLAHATSLVVDAIGLINEPFMAWRYGPIPDKFYWQYLDDGTNNMEVSDLFADGNRLFFLSEKIIDSVYFHFRDMCLLTLSLLTHGEAWNNTLQSKSIQDHDIKNEFREKIITNPDGSIDFTRCKTQVPKYISL